MTAKIFSLSVLLNIFLLVPHTWGDSKVEGAEDKKASEVFEKLFGAEVQRSPEFQTYLGLKDDYDKWNDISLEREAEDYKFYKLQLKQLRKINQKKLGPDFLLSYKLYEKKLLDAIEGYQWRHHNYPVNQMFGVHSNIPSLLINMHKISSEKDALDYIARLEAVPIYMDQLIEGLEARKKKGIIAPQFVFPYVIDDSKNIITGYPFNEGNDSVLMADFKEKLVPLELNDKKKSILEQRARAALTEKVGPAYSKLIAYLGGLQQLADSRAGAWKFPQGDKFYRFALARTTTTDLSAEQVHRIGLDEVARIHNEMREIMETVKFEGTLQEFFDFMRTDKQFFHPQTEAGRQAYLSETKGIINAMKQQLNNLFIVKPKADLVVKAVEPFREKSAGQAFYEGPALDGSRPGTYYANLYDLSNMPIYQMEALAYHEAIPGHHMQISIAQEIEAMPKFRKFSDYTAYIEGWGLYSEFIPKEFGFYKNPYSDFGRLSMELWRACRLVTDTGIHAKKWTREQAIQYLQENTPTSKDGAIKAAERYIVMPSQATAYKIGMLKILELRNLAEQKLGEQYDIREFHDVILKNGALPLDVLDDLVNQWIANKLSEKSKVPKAGRTLAKSEVNRTAV